MSGPPPTMVTMSPDRARAAVTWPSVTRYDAPAPGLTEAGDGVWYSTGEWALLADLPRYRMAEIADPLFRLGLISADGSVDEKVQAYAILLVKQWAEP